MPRGRTPMNEWRPMRWPCSADSSRNAGNCGLRPRSLRNALTGVSQSSMNVWRSGTRSWSRASSRTSSSDGSMRRCGSAATLKEHLRGVGQPPAARAQQDQQVVQDVGGLAVDALVALLAGRARDLLGLLLDLRADLRRVVEQGDGVRAVGALAGALGQRALEDGQRLVRRRRLEVAVVEARALAGVAGRAGGLDQRQQRVAVAVQPQGLHRLRVAGGRALVPQLAAGARPQVKLARGTRALDGLGVGVGQGEHLAGAPVLHDDRHEAALVEGDLHGAGVYEGATGGRTASAARRSNGSISRAGAGRPSRKPWASGHPRSMRNVRCASVSTPSATASMPSAPASSIIAVTIAVASGSSGTPRRNVRSILSTWTGRARSRVSEE